MKYVLYIDYLNSLSFEYRPMTAKTLVDAIEEADELFDAKSMYLVRIMKKVGKTERRDGVKISMYEAVECKRVAGQKWHKNDVLHSENVHVVERIESKYFEEYKLVV